MWFLVLYLRYKLVVEIIVHVLPQTHKFSSRKSKSEAIERESEKKKSKLKHNSPPPTPRSDVIVARALYIVKGSESIRNSKASEIYKEEEKCLAQCLTSVGQ